MAFSNQQQFISELEKAGELIRIKTYVDPKLEIAEITDRISKEPGGGKALLFENTGYDFPVLMNAYGSERRMCLALGVEKLDDIAADIEHLFKLLTGPKESLLDKLRLLPKLSEFASWMPKVKKGRGACQEVVMATPDISKLPVITCWPNDGGPFVTLPVIHTRDPNTNIRNVGMYRMQVFGPTLTGMHWHRHKVSARHFNEYKKLNKKMPVAVALGGDPAYAYSATAPLPDNVDEYMLAGFLRKKKVELVKCITQPEIEVPADADFIIEGYVDPNDELIWEGPFGDHTGYYSLPDWYPKFHITAITHKKNPVYPATIVGIPPQEDAWLGKATERIFLAPIKMTMVPEIVDMDMPVEGVFHNLVITKIQKDYPGQGQKVMNAMWGAGQMMFNKILVLTSNNDFPITDYKKLAQDVFLRLNPATDLSFTQGPMDVLDHSCSKLGFGGKMCIDGTYKYEEEIDTKYTYTTERIYVDVDKIRTSFPEIAGMNTSLLKIDIPCLIVSVKKNRKGHVKELHQQLCANKSLQDIKMILYVEHTVDANDLPVALWRFCNNLDPKRDHVLAEQPAIAEPGTTWACMGLDGTLKTAELDDFHRDWPNIIVAADETIAAVDKKWNELGIGKFIPSPSLKYKDQVYGQEAVAKS
ncbi:menaquinone biosynthesis decarboxylase [Pseudobacter ginsenosidimutans]|uniref:3-octaprenyl-4-hydroxybenzoate decarboxylase n=1 Tax=Pseudobacter ginsenosidimutans TaxID=661488 RepID=A0A4Q7N5P2_9BACT|nr:menaquinone biosynthesis decarboxylase [Pseudobacter ginsenosidimutans]QEC44880.1 menaquinone biosynthesis decarboxylase [Pseudobacter ginsenosidimutans]RZS76371.1 3-octaprenyl-4-hydroxybenzoate decarboxylase [Pseudobacter ginsenosidimutans]